MKLNMNGNTKYIVTVAVIVIVIVGGWILNKVTVAQDFVAHEMRPLSERVDRAEDDIDDNECDMRKIEKSLYRIEGKLDTIMKENGKGE